jgi:hypothetical protein
MNVTLLKALIAFLPAGMLFSVSAVLFSPHLRRVLDRLRLAAPTVIVTNVFPTLPQLSQDCTTVL